MIEQLMERVWLIFLRVQLKVLEALFLLENSTDVTKSDFTAILTKIKGLNVDLIFYAGMDVQGGPMLKQLDNLGLNVNFLTGDGCQTLQFIELAVKFPEVFMLLHLGYLLIECPVVFPLIKIRTDI